MMMICGSHMDRGAVMPMNKGVTATVAEKDMVNIWTLIRHPTASLGVLEPLYFLIVTPCLQLNISTASGELEVK